jgi:hypothetical protein
MSKNLTNAAVIEFDAEVKHEYQGMQTLRSSVSLRTGFKGESYKFTRMGKGIANQKATQADVTPMDIAHARQTATMENWNAGEYTDIFDAAEVNFDEQRELAQTIAKAIGRREDQLVIDALAGVTFATTNDQNPDTGFSATVATNLTVAELRRASQHLNEIEAPMVGRHIALQPSGLAALLADTELTSSDFAIIKALVNGEVNSFMGFNFHMIGIRAEGGLPGVTTAEHAYLWHDSAIGLAVNMDLRTTIDWVAQKTSWLANGVFKAGSVPREPQGIIRILYDETA